MILTLMVFITIQEVSDLNVGSQSYFFAQLYPISLRTEKANQRKLVFPTAQSAGPNLSIKIP